MYGRGTWNYLHHNLRLGLETLQNRYPVKRSALIPMLLYAQDEFGYISDEIIAEIARRLDLRTVAVEETLGVLLDAAPQTVGQASRASVHQRRVYAARRQGTAGLEQRSGWRSVTRK